MGACFPDYEKGNVRTLQMTQEQELAVFRQALESLHAIVCQRAAGGGNLAALVRGKDFLQTMNNLFLFFAVQIECEQNEAQKVLGFTQKMEEV
jgi:hypothetical protein